MRIFVINPGSTSTKFALFEDGKEVHKETIRYSREDLAPFATIYDQLPMRVKDMRKLLDSWQVDVASLDGIAARGGMLPPLKAGAYLVDETLVYVLRYKPAGIHGSNLGGLMAHELGAEDRIPAYIYDAVSVDEMMDEARLSGIKEWPRQAFSHALNTRAVARRYAEQIGKKYEDLTLICAHLGGGISLNIQHKGRIIDTVACQEGPFSTERAGSLDIFVAADICDQEGSDGLRSYQVGRGGLVSYLGTNNAMEASDLVTAGNEEAALVMRAMALQVAKYISLLAADVSGQLDAVILTGGMAFWEDLCTEIKERVRFLAPVVVFPGEMEMEALALGIGRVLKGEEAAHCYVD